MSGDAPVDAIVTSASPAVEGGPNLACAADHLDAIKVDCSKAQHHTERPQDRVHQLGRMHSDKLDKSAPAHPSKSSQPATDIPHKDVSKKQSGVEKEYPVPTMVKQGNTVTLTQVDSYLRPVPVSACRLLYISPHHADGPA